MERLTTGTLPASLPPPFPTFMADRRYDNRFEAARDLGRNTLNQAMLRDGVAGECVAVLFALVPGAAEAARRAAPCAPRP